jgi:hypothetical protein
MCLDPSTAILVLVIQTIAKLYRTRFEKQSRLDRRIHPISSAFSSVAQESWLFVYSILTQIYPFRL